MLVGGRTIPGTRTIPAGDDRVPQYSRDFNTLSSRVARIPFVKIFENGV